GGAARTEQRDPLDPRAMPAQEKVGGPAFEVVAEEGVDDHVAMVDAAYRAIRVDLERQLRGACDIVRHFDQRVRIAGDGSASDASRTAARHSRFRGRIGGIGAISGAAVGAATASLRSVAAPRFMNTL